MSLFITEKLLLIWSMCTHNISKPPHTQTHINAKINTNKAHDYFYPLASMTDRHVSCQINGTKHQQKKQ